MSGHSKWAQIKRQKGVADIKRGQAFTKIANGITIAVRQGGGITDPNQNFRLRLAIDKARELNMPKDNIERAIERGKGKGDKGEGLKEIVYEGFGPGRIAIIIEAATDNNFRTTSEIKNIFEKNNAILASPGAVSYQFEQKGLITVKKNGKSFDEIFLIAVDSGAEDLEEVENEVLIYTKPQNLNKIKELLLKNNLIIQNFELIRKPISLVLIINKEIAEKIFAFIEKLEGLDDVQKVYSNFDISDDVLKQMGIPF